MTIFHAHHETHVMSALLFLGSIFVFMFLCSLTRRHNHRGRKRANSSIDLASPILPIHVNERKKTLSRHISRLEKQLALRKSQLDHHEELEEILTARNSRTSAEEEDWEIMMAKGKHIYGDAWDQSVDGNLPISTLMNMKKEDLDDIRAQARAQLLNENKLIQNIKINPEDKYKSIIERQNNAAIKKIQKSSNLRPSNSSSQWKSYRKTLKATNQTVFQNEDAINPDWGGDNIISTNLDNDMKSSLIEPIIKVPKLDFSKVNYYDNIDPRNTNLQKVDNSISAPKMIETSFTQSFQEKLKAAAERRAKLIKYQKKNFNE